VAIIIEMPKLSDTMSEGKILSWKKKEGDQVSAGEVLAEIESDKANMEMEAYDAGYLRKQLVPEGGSAPVGAAIAIITEDPAEDIAGALQSAGKAKPEGGHAPAKAPAEPAPRPAAEAARSEPAKKTAPPPKEEPAPKARPEPRREAARDGEPARPQPQPSRTAVDAPGEGDGRGKIRASPLAFRMAAELGVDLRSVAGSGPHGRIIKRDIEKASRSPGAALQRGAAPADAPAAARQPAAAVERLPARAEDVPHSSMRRIIAERLTESVRTAPHYYVTMEVDMKAAVRAREDLNAIDGLDITYNDLVIKAAALALARHPDVNASWQGDFIRKHPTVDIGVAVALPEGLITPVVKECHRKSLGMISREVKDLVEKARAKKLAPGDYAGATFTISNLGMFGVKHFTAIINPPAACILAVGGIEEVPVVENGAIVPGRRMALTLSSDHRVVDGARAAEFLRDMKRLLEKPMSLAL
jgi:pyruvate dehydrogenase E2 component (dihydrolipoamide acetyltransferase)